MDHEKKSNAGSSSKSSLNGAALATRHGRRASRADVYRSFALKKIKASKTPLGRFGLAQAMGPNMSNM